jgi:pilus assembly protein Flp/PilA
MRVSSKPQHGWSREQGNRPPSAAPALPVACASSPAAAREIAAMWWLIAASLAQASKEPAMRRPLAALLADRSGTTAVEYGLLVALLTLAIVSSITTVYNDIGGLFNTIAADLQNSPAG